MPLYTPPLKSAQAYTVTNSTINRTADPTLNTPIQNAQVLATLIADLKAAGILQ